MTDLDSRLRSHLQASHDGISAPALDPEWPARRVTSRRRRRLAASACGLVLVSVLGFGAISVLLRDNAETTATVGEPEPPTTEPTAAPTTDEAVPPPDLVGDGPWLEFSLVPYPDGNPWLNAGDYFRGELYVPGEDGVLYRLTESSYLQPVNGLEDFGVAALGVGDSRLVAVGDWERPPMPGDTCSATPPIGVAVTSNGQAWSVSELPRLAPEGPESPACVPVRVGDVAVGTSGFLVSGSVTGQAQKGPMGWWSPDGDAWTFIDPSDLGGVRELGPVVATETGFVVGAHGSEVTWWETVDGSSWTLAEAPPLHERYSGWSDEAAVLGAPLPQQATEGLDRFARGALGIVGGNDDEELMFSPDGVEWARWRTPDRATRHLLGMTDEVILFHDGNAMDGGGERRLWIGRFPD